MEYNIKKDFPFFAHNPNLIYLDNAATSQKPYEVIEAINHFYQYNNAPVHRGIYLLAEQATTQYEAVREHIASFINATDVSEIVFTPGTTASINMVVFAWAEYMLSPGDEIILSQLEHHANLVPWLYLAQQKNIVIKWISVVNGLLDLEQGKELFSSKTKLLVLSNNSNLFGYELTIEPLVKHARMLGCAVVIDAAQAAPRTSLDMQKLDCDFLAFSGHKMMGPTGIGVLYCNKRTHQAIHPYQLGGSMVYEVSFEKAHWKDMPYRLEAGTPPIAQVQGLGAAIKYLERKINFEQLKKHEASLCSYFLDNIKTFPQVKILGNEQALRSAGHSVSFSIENIHPHDGAAFLDQQDICVRAGHHCTQPMHRILNISGSIRTSFYAYTTQEDIEKLCSSLYLLLK